MVGLDGYGLNIVERVPIQIPPNDVNKGYLHTKLTKLDHLLQTELVEPEAQRPGARDQ